MGHPKHFVAAGLLIWSTDHRVLMVQTHNRVGLILPGGLVEDDESPRAASERETLEELGLSAISGQMLTVEHRAFSSNRPSSVSSLQFVFEAERPIDPDTPLELQAEEITQAVWLEPNEALRQHSELGQARMKAALEAAATRCPTYLESH